ncbi:DUF3598 family protein [Synechococcus sp. SYN20]|uniref:DUF3598 family protein n=1 Tax=Synechococcus sp. SYN20 TaxID=1050714 RepID=UPI001644A1FF
MGDWKGSWTRCSPSVEVKETFASWRLFRADLAKTEIVQVNHYRYPDGASIEKGGTTTSKITAIRMGSAALLMPSLLPTQMRPLNSSSSLSTSTTASECFMERIETCCEPPASKNSVDASQRSAGQTPLIKWNPKHPMAA